MNARHGVHLVGGEIAGWSEAGADRPGGTALHALAAAALPAAARILLAGPHRDDLVDFLLGTGAEVTCLLRSEPDARTLGDRHADTAGLAVLCGGLDKLGRLPPFDAIVAAEGLARLTTPDSVPLTWRERHDLLLGHLAEGGTLLLGLENGLGLHRLVNAGPLEEAPDATAPADPAELAALTGGRCYAVYPEPARPSLFVATDEHVGVPDVLVLAALGDGFAGRRVLADPRPVARRAFDQGMGARLAPGWLAVVRPSGELPDALYGPDEPGHWTVACAFRSRDGGWDREPAGTPATMAVGRVLREPALLAGRVPEGEPLAELMTRLCARQDVAGLRRLLAAYARWLAEQPEASLAFATPENVLVEGERFASFDPSWSLVRPVTVAEALVYGLRRFAAGLVASGHPHPWPTSLDPAGICLTLLAMAGHPADRGALAEAITLEAELTAARRGLDGAAHARLLADLAAAEPPAIPGHRELLAVRRRMSDELSDARARAAWADTALREQESALRTARRQVKRLQTELRRLRESRSYRLGRTLTAPTRRFRPKPP